MNTTWLAAQQQRKATQPFQPRPLKLFAKPEAGARAPLASRPTQQGDIERRVSRTPSTASLKAPTVPKSRDTAPTLDLGRYDGGFERDERRGRREAVNSEELAMDSSMEGCVHAASFAYVTDYATSQRAPGASGTLRLAVRWAAASLDECIWLGPRPSSRSGLETRAMLSHSSACTKKSLLRTRSTCSYAVRLRSK